MYVPTFNAMPDAAVPAFLDAHPSALLITVGDDGSPDATRVPILCDWSAAGDLVTVRAHLARSNDHWRRMVDAGPALVDVDGSDAYVSPSWYASKREHGRVVPTWNYTAVQIRGSVVVHDDPEWVLQMVTDLTDRHESGRRDPWQVTDAPEKYVRTRLKAIVGVEVTVAEVDGKAKLSQNRSDDDRAGVVEGLGLIEDPSSKALSALMAEALSAEASADASADRIADGLAGMVDPRWTHR